MLGVGILLGRGAAGAAAWAVDDDEFKMDYKNYNSGASTGGDENQSELVKVRERTATATQRRQTVDDEDDDEEGARGKSKKTNTYLACTI